MRILGLFILFVLGILQFSSISAKGIDNNANSNRSPKTVTVSKTAASMGSINVSNYSDAAYFFGTGSIWSSTTSATGVPDSLGSLSFIFPGNSSRFLYLRNFDFNIPCNAVIESMTVRVTRRNRSTVNVTDANVSTFNPITLTAGSVNMANPSVWVEGGDWETITYTDVNWGEDLTPDLVNNNRFGLIISATNTEAAGRSEPLIDAVEMEICYSLTGSPSTPILFTVQKVDACYNEGSITINATGGSGNYEYSINNGASWQSSNYFGGLSQGDFVLLVRNADMTCQTVPINCNLSGDERILQPGDAVITCATFPGNRVTLAVEKLQPLHDLYVAGETGYDISTLIGPHSYEWDIDDFGGEVFSVAIDDNRNIYTATTIMYDLSPGGAIPVNVVRIDAYTSGVMQIATLPGDAGAAGVEFNNECEELYVANLSDGRIYRLDPIAGTVLSTYDPGSPDNGAPLIAPLGERILALAYNEVDNKLYYAVWNSDYNRSGIRNTIRSVSISPVTCDFLPATDQLEISLPWTSEYGDIGNAFNFSMPVADMEFSQDGNTLIMSESGFDSTVPSSKPHESRALRYIGSTGSWTLQTTLPAGNTNLQYEMGEVSAGLNARGGIAFANSGFNGLSCSIDNEQFIVGTADALRGADCNTLGCIYGLQYLPVTGGKSTNSVLLDIGRDLETQQKSIFGDVDVVAGCAEPLYCCPNLSSSEPDVVICPGESVGTMTVQTQADSLRLVYHTSIPADSASVYSAGIAIDTVPVVGGVGVLSLAALDVSNPIVYYVYAITHPTSDLDFCRPYDSIIVNVRSLPSLSLNDPTDRCVDDSDMNFAGSPLPSGGESAVLTCDAASGFTDNGNGTGTLDISVAGPGTYTIDYQFTDAFGCSNSTSTSVTIFDLPIVSITDPGNVCQDGSALAFSGTPLPSAGISGVFSTNAPAGLIDNGDGTATLDPSMAGDGTYFVDYTFTDNNGCTSSSSVNITVHALPVAGINDPADDCLSGGPMSFTGSPLPAGPTTGTFSSNTPAGLTDNGDGTASLDFSLSGPGVFNVEYNYTDSNGCQDIAITSFEIFDTLPYVDLERGAICGDPSFGNNVLDLNSLILSGPTGGTWFDTDGTGSLSGSLFTADPTMEGNSYLFTYTITGPGPVTTDCQTRSFDVVVDVVYCYLDLALIKTTNQTVPVLENDVVTYNVTICNQGFTNVDSIEVTDYLEPCYGFSPNNGWVSSGLFAVRTLTINNGGLPMGGLPDVSASPNNCITIPIDLTITCGDLTGLISYSEITASRDVAGNTDDFDSSSGSNTALERTVLPGSPNDDSFNDANEDDHDPATMPVADIALTTTVVSTGPYSYGQPVTFQIDIYNQGNVDLYNIEITDYIPCGFEINPGSVGLWNDLGSTATTVISRLDAGQTTSVNILLNILEGMALCANGTAWQNEAEVSNMFDSGLNDISSRDYDSVINNIQGDDGGGAAGTASDDAINGDGTGAVGSTDALTDEDDHDPAFFNLYDLALFKSETSTGPYGQDSIVTYEIIVENQGGMPASNIVIIDYADTGLTYVGSDASTNANVNENFAMEYEVLSLAPGAIETINLTFRIASGFQALNLNNYAEIIFDDGDDIDSDPDDDIYVDEDGDGDPFDDDEDRVLITIQQYYDLSISKTENSVGPYSQGSVITYDITVSNDGTLNASNISVLDSPQTGLSFVGDNTAFNLNVSALGAGVYEVIDLPFGTSETFQVSYAISGTYQDTLISNRVQIISDDGDDVDSDPSQDYSFDESGDGDPFDDDEDELILDVEQFYDLAITKSEFSTGPYYPGDIISYMVQVRNEGSLNAANIVIEDLPDVDLSFVGDDSGSNANVLNTSLYQYEILSLPFGSTESFVISFQINPVFQGDTISNGIQIIGDNGDDIDSDPLLDESIDEDGDGDPLDDDEDRIDIEVQQYYDLSISKTLLTSTDIYPGDPITFRIDIINEGTLHASNIEITENPDFGLFYLSNTTGADPNITEITPNIYTIASLPAYSSTSFEISYTVDFGYLSPQINNIVRISADDGDDIDSDPSLDENFDENGDGDPFDDDEDIVTVGVVVGFYIGDFVWHDLNGDGLQGFNEPGLPGITVELRNRRGLIIEKTKTDSDGYYFFDEIYPGDYYIRVVLGEDYRATFDEAGFDRSIDSDLTEEFGPGTTSLLNLTGDDFSIDAGLVRCAYIGGTVWFDYDTNDRMDETENGINGMTVELYKLEPYGWTLWDEILTGHNEETPSDDGFYKFCAQPGRYYLRFLNPPATLVTVQPGRGAESFDSDVTGRFGQGTTDDFVVQSGEDKCDVGAGYYLMGTIGDYIWVDANTNGLRDEGEEGLMGVVVNAINIEGEIISTAISDEEGNYMLDYLEKEAYYIQVIEPVGYSVSLPNMGPDDTIDSDIDGTNGYGTSKFYAVSPGEHISNVDIGLVAAAILPVDWVDFTGRNLGAYNLLEWEVASEFNLSSYIIERSFENKFEFVPVGQVEFEDSNNDINNYSFKDYNLGHEVKYYQYRLKQVDFDGNFSYSRIITISVDENSISSSLDVNLFPNPTVDFVRLKFSESLNNELLKIELLDKSGRIVHKFTSNEVIENQDRNELEIQLYDIPQGVYFMKIVNIEGTITKKIIIADY